MPAVTRSQTKARREAVQRYLPSRLPKLQKEIPKTQNSMQLVPEKSTFELVSSTNTYKDIFRIASLHYGRATTKETMIFKKESSYYQVHFDYTFAYGYSNGLYDSIFNGLKFIKSDNTTISDSEKEILLKLVKQYYK